MRKQVGMSKNFAEKIGVSRQAVTKWETGAGQIWKYDIHFKPI